MKKLLRKSSGQMGFHPGNGSHCEIVRFGSLHGSPQAALWEMGSVRDCSRKEMRILSRATAADVETTECVWYLEGKTIQTAQQLGYKREVEAGT